MGHWYTHVLRYPLVSAKAIPLECSLYLKKGSVPRLDSPSPSPSTHSTQAAHQDYGGKALRMSRANLDDRC